MSSNDLTFKIKTLFQGQLYTFDPNKQFLKYNKYGHTTSLFKLSRIIYSFGEFLNMCIFSIFS